MRIDSGPNYDEVRDSVENGKVVTFRSNRGEEARRSALNAKADRQQGRAASNVEEQNYRYKDITVTLHWNVCA